MSDTKVVIGPVRFSYVNVFEPKAGPDGGPEKYSVAVLIPKDNEKAVKAVKDAIDAAIAAGAAKLAGTGKNVVKSTLKLPLRDGDEEKPDDEVYAGMFFLNASTQASNGRPQIVDSSRNPIMDQEEFYSGCWGYVSINFYAFSRVNKGIAAGLQNLMKTKDDDKLSGGSTAAQDFGEIEIESDDLAG